MQNRIEEQILILSLSADREALLISLKKEDYNLLFRQTCASAAALHITEFLYQYKDELKLDINAKGKISKKGAIEVAIENNAKDNVLFLLKLEEIEIDMLTLAKIEKKFAITLKYKDFTAKLKQMKREIEKLLDNYVKNTSQIITQINNLNEMVNQAHANTTIERREEVVQTLLRLMDEITKEYTQKINYLNSNCKSFEETVNQYLPYSYAMEKMPISNKNTCIQERIAVEKITNLSQQITDSTIGQFAVIMSFTVKALGFFSDQGPVANIAKLTIRESKDFSSPDPIQDSAKQISIKREPNKKDSSNNVLLKTAPNNRQERLKDLLKQLSDLKQKGQVKLNVVLGILKDINKEIKLQIKQTKSGFLVSQGTNRYSFHTPHEDKGVDKAFLEQIQKMVKEHIPHEGNFNKNP